ncbi:methylthioribulose-1-phosphate dehydratase isoform X2 [Venturia canescens]|uniref:methylthioribulose-1-phosphate dehydratase isoform X2 n=1 Tax=Venturia canescens TaxID=32260 RepID=UPI001C9C7B1A|nr:methylthioribulose-1-phosphate dehydratase isoform X2 [Venturia canescens]
MLIWDSNRFRSFYNERDDSNEKNLKTVGGGCTVASDTGDEEMKEHPRNLIPELCRQFYHLGWVTGTGGGISIKKGTIWSSERTNMSRRFICPRHRRERSGITTFGKETQKISVHSAFHVRLHGQKCWSCHSHTFQICCYGHSFVAWTRVQGIKNQELGRSYRYDEELVIPIIENTPFEEDLRDRMAEVMEKYPATCAILVRRHGVYVWGDTWQQAKTMTECYDYLFDVAIQMKQSGINPSLTPDQYELKYQRENKE